MNDYIISTIQAKGREIDLPRRLWVVFLMLPATAALYLGYAAWLGAETGFPVDDAWIHQTFARNLIARGELAYNVGEPSTASTSPLWTVLAGGGYLLPLGFRPWVYALGLLFLGLTSLTGYLLCQRLFPHRASLPGLAALAILLEWRLNWAALSGMETALFTFVCLTIIYLVTVSLTERLTPSRLCLLGVMAGLATVVRPEGVVLAVMAFGALVWRGQAWRWVASAILISLFVVLPVATFNQVAAGTPLPSTFYAKHAAYSQLLGPGFVVAYLGRAIATLASGPLVMLLPGVAFVILRLAGRFARWPLFSPGTPIPASKSTSRHVTPSPSGKGEGRVEGFWTDAAPIVFIGLWVTVTLGLYMVRLPALYHHGRYLMPLIPPLLVVGLGGLAGLLELGRFRILPRLYGGLAVLVFLVLWVNGAVVYGWDVKFIDDEQVETAWWLRDNSLEGALVATHDVGAIGYFSGRAILDTAGLITPELAPYVRDQQKILSYLEAKKVDYLAVFPKWYPSIVADSRFEEVFRVDHPYAVPAGADNMRVYRARW